LNFASRAAPNLYPWSGYTRPTRGAPAHVLARLTTASNQPVTFDDLLVVHTEKLHLLIVDASLRDYHHIHPAPTSAPGELAFDFTPAHGGRYRVFADFTPRATGRALYAGADLEVEDGGLALEAPTQAAADEVLEAEQTGLRFRLVPGQKPVRINQSNTLELAISRTDGGPVALQEVMGAPAHLVAFDRARTGFAHLHPTAVAGKAASTPAPRLEFSLNLGDPGMYRIWAQVKIDGRELFAPFDLRVQP
jgi:hypothetical protein